jgi:Tfp pilus assembly protein PilX
MMRRLSARRGDDSGMALVLVIGVCSVLTIAIVAGISLAVGSMRKSRADQDWSAAIAAAYAGIEEYQSRLANDTSYFQYGNPAARFSQGSKVSLPTGAAANKAFGIGTDGTWAEISGSGGAAAFRYEVDTSAYAASGTIKLRSTGRAGGDTRSIVADLKQSGFIDFLYFTDYEIQDPANSGKNEAQCVKYAWAGRPGGMTGNTCSEIAFGSKDVIDGPAHSNDVMRVCDATFKGTVTTAYNPASGRKFVARNSGGTSCSGAAFALPNSPAYSPVIGMPATNSELRREVRSDLPGEVPRPGCLYTGPTSITYTSDGFMTVRSPWTKATRVAGSPATSGTAPAECGTVSTASNGLGSAGGAKIRVPEYNVVYVQNVPSATTDPNYWAANVRPAGFTCTGANGSAAGNGIGYPMANEAAPSTSSYGCRNGDAFVSGVLKGQQTLAAENYIYVVDNLTYANVEADMLGLIGNNAVWVWNPVNANNGSLLSKKNRDIHGGR